MDDRKSILTSIKKLHGISKEDTSFDMDITMLINSALLTLTQIGLGPSEGFYIEDDTKEWTDFVDDAVMAESIATYVYVKVRLVFDPPASPTVVEALKSSANEYLWRFQYGMEQDQ